MCAKMPPVACCCGSADQMHFCFWNENRIWRYQQLKFYKHFYKCDFEIWLDSVHELLPHFKNQNSLKDQGLGPLLCEVSVDKSVSQVWDLPSNGTQRATCNLSSFQDMAVARDG